MAQKDVEAGTLKWADLILSGTPKLRIYCHGRGKGNGRDGDALPPTSAEHRNQSLTTVGEPRGPHAGSSNLSKRKSPNPPRIEPCNSPRDRGRGGLFSVVKGAPTYPLCDPCVVVCGEGRGLALNCPRITAFKKGGRLRTRPRQKT